VPRLEPGESVDRYVVERVLGDGGMATVYLVKHAHLGSHHALKVLSSELLVDAGIRARFLAEGRIQAQLAHPNIARVTDVVSEPGVAALVVEYIEGPTLDDWLDERGAGLPAREILAIILPVLDAVEAAHERGVLHRDLKPSNIILGKGVGSTIRPVVLDFGIAGITDDADVSHGRRRRTRTGAQLGTPAYMSPEQIRNTGELDGRTDIFSLGAILYELATGRIAFEADSDFDTLANVVSGTFEAPESVPGDARGAIGACIDKALAVDRDQRFATIAALRAALQAATNPRATSVLAQPVTDGLSDGPSSVEPLSTVAVEEAAAAPEPFASRTPAPPAPRPPAPFPSLDDEPPRRRSRWPRAIAAILALLGLVVVGIVWIGLVSPDPSASSSASPPAKRADVKSSRSQAARAMSTIAKRQTDPIANADPAVLEAAVSQAEGALLSARTPEALGAHALASVLEGGWHLRNRAWDEDEFAAIETLTRDAFDGPTRPETALARAIIEARACRLLPRSDGRRQGFCDNGAQRFIELSEATSRDPRAWMRVEVGWMAAGFLEALGEERLAARDRPGAKQRAAEAVAVCDRAESAHGRGAVNDHILRSVCLTSAGLADDIERVMHWGRILHAAERDKFGALRDGSAELVFRAPTRCRRLPLSTRNSWNRAFPVIDSNTDRWCAVVGLYALDCPGEARLNVLAGKLGEMMSGKDLPWADPELAWRRTGAVGCYLEGS